MLRVGLGCWADGDVSQDRVKLTAEEREELQALEEFGKAKREWFA